MRTSCAHCGLPTTAHEGADPREVFCCYGCRLVSRIVGGAEGSLQAWTLLRLGVGAFLSMNVMMISLLLYTGALEGQAVPFFRWSLLALATPAMAILGYPFLLGAWQEVRRGRLSLDSLIAVGSFAAFGASAAATGRGDGHIYYDTATMLPLLVTFGKLLEASAKTRTWQLVRGLETLLPATALRIENGRAGETPLDQLRPGDLLGVLPGQRLPADGVVAEGTTVIEEAAFTGESRPRTVTAGDAVIAGTVNGPGSILVTATAVGADMLLRRIIDMVEQARMQPSRMDRISQRAAAVFTPAVLLLALAAAAAWGFVAGDWRQAGFAALSVLVVACPCAMGIAGPLATALAIGRAARDGALVRGGEVLERIGQVRTIFFDKTGTLTTGRPRVMAVECIDPATGPDELLTWLAALESASEHSLARAVRAEASARSLPAGAARDVTIAPGQGLAGRATVGEQSRQVVAGNRAFVAPGRQEPSPADATAVYVAWDGGLRGRVLLADSIRPDAAATVSQLKQMGLTPVLLTGDEDACAQSVASAVGISRVLSGQKPDDKMRVVASLCDGSACALVGDGINDAPALAAASVGIALAAGADLARQAGGVVLLSDQLSLIPRLVSLSRLTRRIIWQNLSWASGYNAVALAAAAGGVLHPLLAAVAMVVSSLTVLGNSLRVQRH